jgi:hypothetical protein
LYAGVVIGDVTLTPEQARQVAAQLVEAADEADELLSEL